MIPPARHAMNQLPPRKKPPLRPAIRGSAKKFPQTLQRWFRSHGRDLPWRRTSDPYAVLVSEFMLQQTTVTAVIPYFERWMTRFPTVSALATSSGEDVFHVWQGLGYYSRARNLHRAAREIETLHGGQIPSDMESLRRLPGIGPYTAAAIMAFAFDQPLPVLDANISRIMARLINFKKNISTAAAKKILSQAAGSLLPESGGRRHTSALMDLGATICRTGQPLCGKCPVHAFCSGTDPARIPILPARQPTLFKKDFRVFARKTRAVFLIPSPGPRWKGLWLLPPGRRSANPLLTLPYSITRYRIRLEVSRGNPLPSWTPFPITGLPPMPAPHLRALRLLLPP